MVCDSSTATTATPSTRSCFNPLLSEAWFATSGLATMVPSKTLPVLILFLARHGLRPGSEAMCCYGLFCFNPLLSEAWFATAGFVSACFSCTCEGLCADLQTGWSQAGGRRNGRVTAFGVTHCKRTRPQTCVDVPLFPGVQRSTLISRYTARRRGARGR